MLFVVAKFYGWSLEAVREMGYADFSRALAVMAGLNEAESEARG